MRKKGGILFVIAIFCVTLLGCSAGDASSFLTDCTTSCSQSCSESIAESGISCASEKWISLSQNTDYIITFEIDHADKNQRIVYMKYKVLLMRPLSKAKFVFALIDDTSNTVSVKEIVSNENGDFDNTEKYFDFQVDEHFAGSYSSLTPTLKSAKGIVK